MRYQVVIVEDDPMVRMLDRSFVELDHRFTVAGEFQDGRAALQWLRNHPADLLILDVYMPSMTGVELLKALREEEIPLDAIMVTAANDAKTVDTLLHLGVVDYLVKPFGQERPQRALDAFCRFREALSADAGGVFRYTALCRGKDRPECPAGPAPKAAVKGPEGQRRTSSPWSRSARPTGNTERKAAKRGRAAENVCLLKRYRHFLRAPGWGSGSCR